MITRKFKNLVLLLLSGLTIFISATGLIGCNGSNEQKADTEPGLTPQDTFSTVIVTNSRDSLTLPALLDNQQQNVNEDPQKVLITVTNDKKAALPKNITAEQPVVVNINPAVNKPVTMPVPDPVTKIPEPVKPIPEKPRPVEDPVKPPVVVTQPEQNSWIVPAKYKTMTSPSAADKESIALGKSLYATHCKSCHGSKGEGDGTKAASLDTEIRSFLDARFQAQKPGEIYYKSIIGRKDMPKFEKKIRDEDERWAIVDYIMSLKN
ncbi:MAG: c-type cytochrome [Ferruginibacter sp.]